MRPERFTEIMSIAYDAYLADNDTDNDIWLDSYEHFVMYSIANHVFSNKYGFRLLQDPIYEESTIVGRKLILMTDTETIESYE